MKKADLVIKNNILNLKISDNYSIPNWREIFKWKFRGQETINEYFIDNIPDIKFSKYPTILSVNIILSKNDKVFKLDFFANEKPIKLLYHENKIINHIIIDNSWYPLIEENINEIEDLIKEYKIKDFKFDLSTYILINKNLNDHPVIKNLTLIEETEKIEKRSLINYKNDYFKGELYDYQEKGFEWLRFYANNNVGGILGDEMGLGKTIQIISLICHEVNQSNVPNLVIVRSTLVNNWIKEFKKFSSNLKIYTHHGPNRSRSYKAFEDHHVTISTYDLASIDLPLLTDINWNLIILDEAQDIRNPDAQRTKSIKILDKKAGFAVTGTPIQNKLKDLWSIMDFTNHDYLGNENEFMDKYSDDFSDGSLIEPLVRPLILRRTIEASGKTLPDRIDIPEFIQMNNNANEIYESEKNNFLNNYKNNPLPMLIKLRQVCTNSMIINDEQAWDEDDTKFVRLIQICEEFIMNEEKFLIFTSFTKAIKSLSNLLKRIYNIPVFTLFGETPIDERQSVIDDFSNIKNSSCMVLNPAVASAGLNIVSANHVIHYNLEWNPAVIDQASARIYRIGQKRNVTVHYLVYSNTIEHYIYERLEAKRQMAEDTIIGVDSKPYIEDFVKFLNKN
tara:strand:+ start:3371 stop:5227 length:1857 start_codon:yes stop_codon:yes gene_type:complete